MGNTLFLMKKFEFLASILVHLSVDRWLWLSADAKTHIANQNKFEFLFENIIIFKGKAFKSDFAQPEQ